MEALRTFLAYPQTAGLDLDDPATTALRKEILRKNGFLRQVYHAWYAEIARELPPLAGAVLELGAGAGFLKTYVPGLIASEVLPIGGVDLTADALALPLRSHSLRALVLINVLHHLPDADRFLAEAQRCLVDGGRVILIEPWMTDWSRFVYTRLHHEPLDLHAVDWRFTSNGPLSGANEALPWIIFQRDRARFERRFAQLQITRIEPIMPFVYLLSGGFTSRLHFPGKAFAFCRWAEMRFSAWRDRLGLFAVITLTKTRAVF
jgi:SAM-dependent methyltransferase